jgi:tetratricopeptide (TPR) repeat protein
VADTYKNIITDFQRAVKLLPAIPGLKYRPSKSASYGMLARVYLSMSDYTNAEKYADSALALYSKLINYNTLNASAAIPFSQFNDEVIYDSRAPAAQALSQSRAKVDTTLYLSYAANDLRKTVFFKTNANGSKAFKGNYTGVSGASLFTGVATNELLLIKAEASIRNGEVEKALGALNTLLKTRWKTGTFIPFAITDKETLLNIVLNERRKELLFRTLRWTDLRRLNLDPDKAKTLYRNLGGTIYTLEPNGSRYVFQIDQDAVNLSGLPQNP